MKFNLQYAAGAVALLVLIGVVVYSNQGGEAAPVVTTPQGEQTAAAPSHTSASQTPTPTKTGTTGTASSGATTVTTSPAPATVPNPTPAPTPTPTPEAQSWSPGFMASTRVTPEIPSENERATLPSCSDKKFSLEPVTMAAVSTITSSGVLTTFNFSSQGTESKYELVAPADMWITHVAQETGITADPEDTTIYFALCRDVIGYITNVKEMSAPIYKMITDSPCLSKPHVGPGACHVKVLELISRGSNLGKVGRYQGAFGFGVIDLSKQHADAQSSQTIRANFAACAFNYFSDPQKFFSKLTVNGICSN